MQGDRLASGTDFGVTVGHLDHSGIARVIDFGAVACSEDFAQQGAARHRTKVSF